jgi:hypothetical protein
MFKSLSARVEIVAACWRDRVARIAAIEAMVRFDFANIVAKKGIRIILCHKRHPAMGNR